MLVLAMIMVLMSTMLPQPAQESDRAADPKSLSGAYILTIELKNEKGESLIRKNFDAKVGEHVTWHVPDIGNVWFKANSIVLPELCDIPAAVVLRDESKEQSPSTTVFRLRNVAAADVAQSIADYFQDLKPNTISISAHELTNSVVVVERMPDQHGRMSKLIGLLDRAPPELYCEVAFRRIGKRNNQPLSPKRLLRVKDNFITQIEFEDKDNELQLELTVRIKP